MTTESMSIHRALVELKTIDSRIIKKIDSAKFCVAAKAKTTKLGAITVDEFKTYAKLAITTEHSIFFLESAEPVQETAEIRELMDQINALNK